MGLLVTALKEETHFRNKEICPNYSRVEYSKVKTITVTYLNELFFPTQILKAAFWLSSLNSVSSVLIKISMPVIIWRPGGSLTSI